MCLIRPTARLLSRASRAQVHAIGLTTGIRHYTPAQPSVPRSQSASMTLQPMVFDLEKATGRLESAVGKTGNGSEGGHYLDAIPQISNDLNDSTTTGRWTMFQPIYTKEELDAVQIVHRETKTIGDKIAHTFVKTLRGSFDFFTGYKETPIPVIEQGGQPHTIAELRKMGCILSEKQWLMRIVLLETTAGVPGIVGGMIRHLQSLRLMRRDGGWIHTLLEEAENERMHLMTFLAIRQPGPIFRGVVLAAQGMFVNFFFLTYLFFPKVAHRFVGALEEEAVHTYTKCLDELENGYIPEWSDKAAPKIAIDYWRLEPDAKMVDVIRAVRADEATHRFVNHTLANLDQKMDFSPFSITEPNGVVRGSKVEFTREEAAAFSRQAQQQVKLAAVESGRPDLADGHKA